MTNLQSPQVLILGGAGLIGHRLLRTLVAQNVSVAATIHKSKSAYAEWDFLQDARVIDGIDVLNQPQLIDVLNTLRPRWILNAVGLTIRKQQPGDKESSLRLNSLLPHELDRWCRAHGARLIHYSTDCVFSGRDGNYSEESVTDAADLYGKTKSLGEVTTSPSTLTLRSSFLGRELEAKTELVEWFLAQKGRSVQGFETAMYSGVTTAVLSELTLRILREKPLLSGLYQIASDPISKYELLRLMNEAFALNVEITPVAGKPVNKVLSAKKWIRETGWTPPAWRQMIAEMAADAPFYTRG